MPQAINVLLAFILLFFAHNLLCSIEVAHTFCPPPIFLYSSLKMSVAFNSPASKRFLVQFKFLCTVCCGWGGVQSFSRALFSYAMCKETNGKTYIFDLFIHYPLASCAWTFFLFHRKNAFNETRITHTEEDSRKKGNNTYISTVGIMDFWIC